MGVAVLLKSLSHVDCCCGWGWIDIQLHCLGGCPAFPKPLIVETVASLFYILGAVVGNELTTYVSVSSWDLY